MKKVGKVKFSKELAFTIDVVLLVIHIYLLLFFAICHMPIMVVVNIFSVGIYTAMMKVVKNKPYFFMLVTFGEILLHMILAIIFVGWDFGFQFYCFALIPLIFFCDYLSHSSYGKSSHPIQWSILVIVCFLLLRIYTWNFEAVYHAKHAITVVFSAGINAVFIFVFLILYIANYESLTIQTEKLASKDALTGLNNRYKMQNFMELVQEQDEKLPMAVAMMDIDNFKRVNDTYGHDVGDIVLKEVAGCIKKAQSERLIVCRWGGEEFLVVAFGENCHRSLQQKMRKLVEEVAGNVIKTEEVELSVTITVGVAVRKMSEDLERTIIRADKYLYEGKLSGKNKMVAGDGEVF